MLPQMGSQSSPNFVLAARMELFMILLIDNYDSFTYNLYQYIGEINEDIKVARNDEITINDIEALNPSAIVISPGSGYPKTAGISIDVIKNFAGKIPILGVCLGHQAIGEAFGGKVVHTQELMHGKSSDVLIDNNYPIFKGLPEKLTVARYHSLIVESVTLPSCLTCIAKSEKGEIMAICHKEYPVYGLQFHPESILTKFGKRIIRNFICGIADLPAKNPDTADNIPLGERNNLKKYITKVIDSEDLNQEESEAAMECIMNDEATDAQIGSFLTALRMKGETINEITGFARVMRKKAAAVSHKNPVVDIVGTGGDMANTFNISTTAAFVAAGAGLCIAKHGNRSVSSRSGSADVLEALGIQINVNPAQASECLDKIGITFMFAQSFHKSMRFAASPRREIGVRSVFNILGPLSNPASAEYMLLGVYDEQLLEVMAMVLMNLGVKSAVVVIGADGLDEITLSDKTKICEIKDGKLIKYEISPTQFGMEIVGKSELVGGTAKENAEITLDILKGKKGAQRNIVLLNAAAALYAAGSAQSIDEGVKMAAESIDSGAALKKLEELKAMTNAY
jgi:anthranilate synthase/phosphoribosyltransferase